MDKVADGFAALITVHTINYATKYSLNPLLSIIFDLSIGLLWLISLIKLRRGWLLRKIRTCDVETCLNHWLLGTAFNRTDTSYVGGNRIWQTSVLTKMKKKYPNEKMFKVWLAHMPHIYLVDADAAAAISKNNEFNDKTQDYNFYKPWLGEGILISKSTKWKNRRRMITASFHYSILDSFREQMIDCTLDFVDQLKKSKQSRHNVVELFNELSLIIICKTAMGYNLQFNDEKADAYRRTVDSIKRTVVTRSVNPLLWPEFAWKISGNAQNQQNLIDCAHRFTRPVINGRIAEFRKLNQEELCEIKDQYALGKIKRRLAFLDTLIFAMDFNEEIDIEGIYEETEIFMFAGHDTTSSALSFSLGFICEHQDVYDKCLAEINEILGENTRPSLEDLKNMKYLDACIKESMRLRPPVRLWIREQKSARILTVADEEYYITPNTPTSIVGDIIQTEEKHFSDPFKFRPERFLSGSRHSHCFLPFSAGARNCIGQNFSIMEIKIILVFMLKHFAMKPEIEIMKVTVQSNSVSVPYPHLNLEITSKDE